VNELYRPSDRRLSAKLVPAFVEGGCRAVSTTDPYGRILGLLDRSRYFFFQVAPQLYSRGWVDPVPDPLFLRKSDSAGNRTRDLWIYSHCSYFSHRIQCWIHSHVLVVVFGGLNTEPYLKTYFVFDIRMYIEGCLTQIFVSIYGYLGARYVRISIWT
jgi:hypothetical protein